MQDSASSVDAETLACLRSHFTELHTLFTGLMDAQGHAALSELRNAVVDAAGEWGLNPEAVRTLILPRIPLHRCVHKDLQELRLDAASSERSTVQHTSQLVDVGSLFSFKQT